MTRDAVQIVNEGVSYLRRYIGEDRVVQGGLKELEALLKELYPTTESVGKDFQDQLMKLEPGSCVLEFGPELEAGYDMSLHEVR